jgi:Zinc-binding loop region of homing endonuclease
MPTSTRLGSRKDPTHDRRHASKATHSNRATRPQHDMMFPYEWLTSPRNGKQVFHGVWRAMIKHKSFKKCNTHITAAEMKQFLKKLDFEKLHHKPPFSPYANTGANYSQVTVEKGGKMRVTAHVFAVIYRLRFIGLPKGKKMAPAELRQMLERSGTSHAFEASHLCSNYKGCGHDCNPLNLTLEPLEINQSRRTCHLRWAKNQYRANPPEPANAEEEAQLTKRFIEDGDSRYPPLEESHNHKVDKDSPFCCTDLHEPPCLAYYGPIPKPIQAREMAAEQAMITRKTRRASQLEEQKRKEEEERALKRARANQ